ncbi:MAG: hypothetical protein LLF96_04095 [Eubacteriales bacterium]|nr:hypothetical protein [Eubacteriales bacterium]
MKKSLQALAWALALCLLTGSAVLPGAALAEGTTYVWVGSLLNASLPAAVATITVNAVSIGGRTPATDPAGDKVWFSVGDAVTFSLTDTIADNAYTYDVSIDGGATYPYQGLSDGFTLGDLGLASNQTPYAMVFRVNDADDAANFAISSLYYVYYDDEAPVLLCKAATDNTLVFFAGDDISGFSSDASVNNITFDANTSSLTWAARLVYRGQNVYSYSVRYSGAGTILAGTLAVKDAAGNIAVWGEDITISAGSSSGGISAGSGGSSSGRSSGTTTTRTVYYSSSTYTSVTPYNGVDLVVGTGAMQTLVIGDQSLNLTLQLDGSSNGPGSEEEQPAFSASFADWSNAATAVTDTESETADTLVLSALDATQVDGENAYCWTFDGSVYKKLAASGIDYVVFSVGDQATALSTAGFTAGLRYNMYRAAGIASKSFVYTIRMDETGVKVQVTVDGETYTLSNDPNSDFYYYDLYSGTIDMLNQPFGQVSSDQSTASEGR